MVSQSLRLIHPTQLLLAAGISQTRSAVFLPQACLPTSFPQLTEGRLWMLSPGCTWISAHQTQQHVFPWCWARKRQKGERRHLFQEATYKIITALCSGEKQLPPVPISWRSLLQKEDRKGKEPQLGGSGRSKTTGPHLRYPLGSVTNLHPSANIILRDSEGKLHSTVNIQRKLTCWRLTVAWISLLSNYCLIGEGAEQVSTVSTQAEDFLCFTVFAHLWSGEHFIFVLGVNLFTQETTTARKSPLERMNVTVSIWTNPNIAFTHAEIYHV